MRKLVIFGGSGYIGQAVCQEALTQGFSVYSISKHGKPTKQADWMHHPSMTWLQADILQNSTWQTQIPKDAAYLNLIGILFESKNKTYADLIVATNNIISQFAADCNQIYFFLSAQIGPKKYLAAKHLAEQELQKLKNPIIVLQSGLVVSSIKKGSHLQGWMIRCASYLPFIGAWAKKGYPIERTLLAKNILKLIINKKTGTYMMTKDNSLKELY